MIFIQNKNPPEIRQVNSVLLCDWLLSDLEMCLQYALSISKNYTSA